MHLRIYDNESDTDAADRIRAWFDRDMEDWLRGVQTDLVLRFDSEEDEDASLSSGPWRGITIDTLNDHIDEWRREMLTAREALVAKYLAVRRERRAHAH